MKSDRLFVLLAALSPLLLPACGPAGRGDDDDASADDDDATADLLGLSEPGLNRVGIGYLLTCWLDAAGAVECFGDSATEEQRIPGDGFVDLAVYQEGVCALREDGRVSCSEEARELLEDTMGAGWVFEGTFEDLVVVRNYQANVCGIRPGGEVECLMTDADWSGESMRILDAGIYSICGATETGSVTCPQTGNGIGEAAPAGDFSMVVSGAAYGCGLRSSGELRCWLGEDLINAPTGQFVRLAGGTSYACAIRADDLSMVCWGYDQGTLQPPSGRFVDVAAAENHACGLREDGFLDCWGAVPNPGDDDDAADDDDVAPDDDDIVDDDDIADDDDATNNDLVDAAIPTFPSGCTGNRFKAILGDGTELDEVEGFIDTSSFANTANEQAFRIRLGIDGLDPDSQWVQLSGDRIGLAGGGPYALPDNNNGPMVLQAWIGADSTGGPAPTVGAFGMPLVAYEEVGGTVEFTQNLPEPEVLVVGEFSGILQGGTTTSSNPSQVILLGIAGCFEGTLMAQNG